MSQRSNCAQCGKRVYRDEKSKPQIICHDCRRKQNASCTVDGCDNIGKIVAGLCWLHYQRERRCGDPLAGPAYVSCGDVPCATCGVIFSQERVTQRYCSLDCRHVQDRSRQRTPRTCPACGKSYHPTVHRQKTCSKQCAYALRRLQNPPEVKAPSSKVRYANCKECGRLFIARQSATAYCGKTCGDRAYNRHRYGESYHRCPCGAALAGKSRRCDACQAVVKAEARRRKKRAERARKRGIKTEPYTLTEIAERDKNRCGLCRKRVAMTKTVPHPKAPTIDHVVPVAKGGDDVRSNVQLAHFICNSRKNTGGTQQLALVG